MAGVFLGSGHETRQCEMTANLVLLLIHPVMGSPGSCSYPHCDLEVSTRSHRVLWDSC